MITLAPLALVSATGAAKAPAPQAAATNCTRLYGHLGTSVKEPKGVIGYPVFITNISRVACTIQGVPTITYNPPTARRATRVYAKSRGGAINLAANGGAVDVLISISPTAKFSAARCAAVKTRSTRVTFGPKKGAVAVVTSFAVCSKLSSSTVSGVALLSVPLT